MNTKKKLTSFLAVTMALLMALTSVNLLMVAAADFTAPDGWYTISDTKKLIAPGIAEDEIIINNSTGQSQVMGYSVTVDMSAQAKTKIIAGYNNYDGTKWAMQSVRDQAYKAEKARSLNVVAAFNADIYNMQTGEPSGPLVMNGINYKSALGRPYFAVLKDGSTKIGGSLTQEVLDNAEEAVGGFFTLVENGARTASGYSTEETLAPRTAIGIKPDGNVVIYVADGRNYPISCGLTLYDLTSIMLGFGCVDVLNLDGGGSTTYAAQYEGSATLDLASNPSDGVERKVSSTLFVVSTAAPTGEFDHASLLPNNEVYTPKSTVQFSATGVDSAGGQAPLPAGGCYALAADSADLGTISADGLFESNGKAGVVNVNYMNGGTACGTVSIEIAVPDTLYVPNSEVSLGFEDTTDFGIVAKYNDRTVNMKDGDLNWQIKDEGGNDISSYAGDFNGLTFTTKDGVTVNAIVTATLAYDSAVSTDIKAIIGAMPSVIYDFEYTTDQAEADANPELKYIPSYSMPRFDRTIEASEGKNHYVQAEEFRQAGYPLYCWPNSSITDQESMKATVVSKDSGEPVRFGDHSLRIDYNYSTYNGSSNSNNYLRVTNENYFFDGSPTALGCWVYVPEGTANFHLYLNCGNKNLESRVAAYQPVTGKTGINWTGWKYVEFDLSDTTLAQNAGAANAPYGFYQGCGVFWISYQVGNGFGDRTASTVYLDNIQLVYGANTDDIDNPLISSIRKDEQEIVDGETTFTSNVNTFKASYADFDGKYSTGIDFSEVKMLIDGVDVTSDCYINEGDEEIYLYDKKLSNGTHSIEISVSDKFGNTTTDIRYFTVDAPEESTEVAMTPASASPILGEDYVLEIKANNGNVQAADVDLKILSYFVKYWNNYNVVAGDNYTLDAAATYDANNAVISFAATRKTDASSEDNTIARVIFSIPTDVPENLEVVYRIAKGDLTLTDGKSSFSGKITTTCKSPFIVATDTMVVGSAGGNIYITDADGAAVENVNIYTSADELVGVTDVDGKLFTDKFIAAVADFSIYAEKEGSRSFVYTSQSYPAGGETDGTPTYVKLNASKEPSTSQSISWMASPLASKAAAVVQYAEKAKYASDGDAAFATFDGKSDVIEMSSSASVDTNYAVRINHATLTGLTPDTEYVYKVGDGELMSAVKEFKTNRKGTAVDFFVIGDTQATDTTNTDEITRILSESGVDYDFGIQTGDAVDNGGNYTMWANIAKVFSGDFLGNQSMVQVLGNHEFYGDLTGTSASAYFDLPGTENKTAPLCYSTQYGNVYVAVINYGGINQYEQAAEWIKKDAAASTATWKILTMHQPAYYTNPSGNNAQISNIVTELADSQGFDFVFSGHDHSYARTMPVKAGDVNDEGTVYYICGSTGEKSYEIIDNADFHFAKLDGDYNATYLTANVTDTTFTITTHDYTAGGDAVVLDTYTKTKTVDCTESGHAWLHDNGEFSCSVCDYVLTDPAYTGFAHDKATGRTMYFLGGNAQKGWFSYFNDCYYFDENGLAVTGEQTIDGIDYVFDNDGKQIGGAFVTDEKGVTRCYRGGTYLKGWQQIGDYLYYFSTKDGAMRSGETTVTVRTGKKLNYVFSADGKLLTGAFDETDEGIKYYWGGDLASGWTVINGQKYYFDPQTNFMAIDNVEIDGVMQAFSMEGVYCHEGAHNWEEKFETGANNCHIYTFRSYTCSECGETKLLVEESTDHTDEDHDGVCDICGATIESFSNVSTAYFAKLVKAIIEAFKKIIIFFYTTFNQQ